MNKTFQISPTQFEIYVKKNLESCGTITNFKIEHNKILKVVDGDYQIDVYCEIEVFNIPIKIIVECKKHKNPIKRDVVQLLHSKLQSSGCHKGIIFSTSEFQKGAITYAEKHGIALIKVINGDLIYVQKSSHIKPLSKQEKKEIGIPEFAGEFIYDNSINYIFEENIDSLKDFLAN